MGSGPRISIQWSTGRLDKIRNSSRTTLSDEFLPGVFRTLSDEGLGVIEVSTPRKLHVRVLPGKDALFNERWKELTLIELRKQEQAIEAELAQLDEMRRLITLLKQ